MSRAIVASDVRTKSLKKRFVDTLLDEMALTSPHLLHHSMTIQRPFGWNICCKLGAFTPRHTHAAGGHSMLYAQFALYRTLFDASAHDGT